MVSKLTGNLDYKRNPSSRFRETDNFRLCPISQLRKGQNRKIWLIHFFHHFCLDFMEKNRLSISKIVWPQSLHKVLVVLKRKRPLS